MRWVSTPVDRLFSVGDLVDRGPDNEAALEWLAKPWFHAVQGNHEALAITRVRGGKLDLAMYREAGGGWFIDLPRAEQLRFVERFEQLPIAIEVESARPGRPAACRQPDCRLAAIENVAGAAG